MFICHICLICHICHIYTHTHNMYLTYYTHSNAYIHIHTHTQYVTCYHTCVYVCFQSVCSLGSNYS